MPTIIVIDNIMDKEIGNGSIFRIFFFGPFKIVSPLLLLLFVNSQTQLQMEQERERESVMKKKLFSYSQTYYDHERNNLFFFSCSNSILFLYKKSCWLKKLGKVSKILKMEEKFYENVNQCRRKWIDSYINTS